MITATIVDVVEWIWTTIAAIGVSVAIWALVDSYLDRAALRQSGTNGDDWAVVRRLVRGSRASLVLHAFFLVIGLTAIATPNPPVTVTYIAYASGYIIVAAMNVRAVGLNQLDRVRMRRRNRNGNV